MTTSQAAAQAAIPGTSGGLVRRLGGWAYALAKYLDRRAAIKSLQALDDRALRDLGIMRCHIEFGRHRRPRSGSHPALRVGPARSRATTLVSLEAWYLNRETT